jgi:hypothetical protein
MLKTNNLRDLAFRTIRQIRMKVLVETRIAHAERTAQNRPFRVLESAVGLHDGAVY